MVKFLYIICLITFLSACVSKKDFNDLKKENIALTENVSLQKATINKLTIEIGEKDELIDDLKQKLNDIASYASKARSSLQSAETNMFFKKYFFAKSDLTEVSHYIHNIETEAFYWD